MVSVHCCNEWKGMLKSVLFTETELIARINELAERLSKDYTGNATSS